MVPGKGSKLGFEADLMNPFKEKATWPVREEIKVDESPAWVRRIYEAKRPALTK